AGGGGGGRADGPDRTGVALARVGHRALAEALRPGRAGRPPAPSGAPGRSLSSSASGAMTQTDPTILLVEDAPDLAQVVARELEASGYPVLPPADPRAPPHLPPPPAPPPPP